MKSPFELPPDISVGSISSSAMCFWANKSLSSIHCGARGAGCRRDALHRCDDGYGQHDGGHDHFDERKGALSALSISSAHQLDPAMTAVAGGRQRAR